MAEKPAYFYLNRVWAYYNKGKYRKRINLNTFAFNDLGNILVEVGKTQQLLGMHTLVLKFTPLSAVSLKTEL